jgi:glycosyltransferase involved in cell wall biosynthesis
MMDIWILNHYANVPEFPSGNRHFNFAKELTKRGNRVYVFASSFSHRTRKDIGIERNKRFVRKNIDGVEFIRVKTTTYYGGNNWRRMLNMISYCHNVLIVGLKLKEKPDIILASSPHLFTGLAGYFLAKIKKARFILEIRDLWPETLVDIGNYSNKHILIKLLRSLEKFLYRRAESIIVLMPGAPDYITGLGISIEKIHWIPNGVDIGLFKKLKL